MLELSSYPRKQQLDNSNSILTNFIANIYCYYTRLYHHTPPSLIESDVASFFQVLLALLVAKPEQEQRLLSGLVNKLGDPERKIAANVAHLLALLGEQQVMVYIVFL